MPTTPASGACTSVSYQSQAAVVAVVSDDVRARTQADCGRKIASASAADNEASTSGNYKSSDAVRKKCYSCKLCRSFEDRRYGTGRSKAVSTGHESCLCSPPGRALACERQKILGSNPSLADSINLPGSFITILIVIN
ncbi:uncharacterized protein LOC126190719 [Schistocerca cancellata]|uniref:uncharacterized protein LOC126190719 n=1 Tax=Schistocerca cancellata TaxID=274614 RepID=UPI00211754D0|nr:uncharacterized protein LOC126190719 [Schistocerca cancellata]XP_049787151.1 uncharacterized protein LOC126190719 [Schistocerca cancellata]